MTLITAHTTGLFEHFTWWSENWNKFHLKLKMFPMKLINELRRSSSSTSFRSLRKRLLSWLAPLLFWLEKVPNQPREHVVNAESVSIRHSLAGISQNFKWWHFDASKKKPFHLSFHSSRAVVNKRTKDNFGKWFFNWNSLEYCLRLPLVGLAGDQSTHRFYSNASPTTIAGSNETVSGWNHRPLPSQSPSDILWRIPWDGIGWDADPLALHSLIQFPVRAARVSVTSLGAAREYFGFND